MDIPELQLVPIEKTPDQEREEIIIRYEILNQKLDEILTKLRIKKLAR